MPYNNVLHVLVHQNHNQAPLLPKSMCNMLEHEMKENFPHAFLCIRSKADAKKSKSE